MRRPVPGAGGLQSGYERDRYRDFTTNLGGPAIRDRLWFFAGYQHLRDYDSQPGTDPAFPRTYEQDKIFAKLTWRLAPGWQLLQSFHDEFWVNPELPTLVKPFEATQRRHASVPAMTFGHLTHTLSSNTVWDVRVGRFVYPREDDPSTGNRTTPSRFDRVTGVFERRAANLRRTRRSFARPPRRPSATTGPGCWAPITSGRSAGRSNGASTTLSTIIPTGVRFVDNGGQPFQAISRAPSHRRRRVRHGLRVRERRHHDGQSLTINAGLRFDHSRAISPGPARARSRRARNRRDRPRPGNAVHLERVVATPGRHDEAHRRWPHGAARELRAVQPGRADRRARRDSTPVRRRPRRPRSIRRPAATRRIVTVVDPRINLQIDPETRSPRTDEYSIGVDREVGRRLAVAIAYVRKDGSNFIGWTDVGGQYREETRTLARRPQPCRCSCSSTATADRRFLLTNPEGTR